MGGRLVEMAVESVRVHMLSTQHVVILKDLERQRFLPIWIGPWEANAIAMRLQGLAPERPLTHDLFAGVLAELGVTIREVVIADLTDETFHARILLETAGRILEIDSRPSVGHLARGEGFLEPAAAHVVEPVARAAPGRRDRGRRARDLTPVTPPRVAAPPGARSCPARRPAS